MLIMPDKHSQIEISLLGIGGKILKEMYFPKTALELWKEFENDDYLRDYAEFNIALSMLFILGVVKLENNKLMRSKPMNKEVLEHKLQDLENKNFSIKKAIINLEENIEFSRKKLGKAVLFNKQWLADIYKDAGIQFPKQVKCTLKNAEEFHKQVNQERISISKLAMKKYKAVIAKTAKEIKAIRKELNNYK